MPLLVKGLEGPVCDWLSTAATFWQYSVCIAVVAVRPVILCPVAHVARKLNKAAVALEVLRVPGLLHCSNTIRGYKIVAFGTFWHKILLVVTVTVQTPVLCKDRNVDEALTAGDAGEVVLVVERVLSLHGSVLDGFVANGTNPHISHPVFVVGVCLK